MVKTIADVFEPSASAADLIVVDAVMSISVSLRRVQ
jgi:hypothetical protein